MNQFGSTSGVQTPHSRGKVVVVGGAGYVGAVLSRVLLEAGYQVRVVDRCFFGEEPLQACVSFGRRFELLKADTRAAEPSFFADAEFVVDLAGLSNDPSCALSDGLTHSINVDGGTAVLDAAREAGVRRFVYQSSCSVYGSAGEEALYEASPLAPVSDYSKSKVTMEGRVLEAQHPSFEVVVTRPGTLFGLAPRMRFDLIVNTMTLAAINHGSIEVQGGGNQWRPLIHVYDNALALQTILEAPSHVVDGKVFNVGDNRHNYRVADIAAMVAGQFDGVSISTVGETADPRNYRCQFDRIQAELGFIARFAPESGVREIAVALGAGQVDTGIKTRTVDYYRYLIDGSEFAASERV